MSIDYVSNLHAPDLRPHFKHLHWREMGHSFGHLVASDWADKSDDDPVFGLYKKCGLWTRDEAAILYQIARRVGGDSWVDLGAHTGWTTAHIVEGSQSGYTHAVDPMLSEEAGDFQERLIENLDFSDRIVLVHGETSEYFFWKLPLERYDGIVIDGDHEPGKPLEDAINASKHLKPGGVIVFHDFIGEPVREAVAWLIDTQVFMCRIYLTPHVVAVCWRPGERVFEPPFHVPEKGIVEQQLFKRWHERDWRRYA